MSKNKLKKKSAKNITKKHIHIHGYIDSQKAGWKNVVVYGTPEQRGFAHGFLLYQEMERVLYKLPFLVKQELETTPKKYLSLCKSQIKPILQDHYPEYYKEICAIVNGVKYQNPSSKITVDILVAWNSFLSMYEYIHNPATPKSSKRNSGARCSAIIATGSYTKTGKIVMGHTSHSDLVSASLYNIILYMIPDKGVPFLMQTAPGCIASGTDWFITKIGIIGCETTIGDISYRPIFDNKHHPYFCRIRCAMQYGKSLQDYSDIMTKKNSGDYACSWLFGNVETNEIMLCELGLEKVNVETTKDGIYWGMNSAMSSILRLEETNDSEFFDMQTSSGARNARFQQLISKYFGKITEHVTLNILMDHIDPYNENDSPTAKSICAHSYDDSKLYEPNYPHGCTDVKITTTEMVKNGEEFMARFGPACGRPFIASSFFKKNPKYRSKFEPYLDDFVHQPVVNIRFDMDKIKKVRA